MSSQLPTGRYVARLMRRKAMPTERRGGIEYVFQVANGEYAGEKVTMRLWAPGRIERADEILPGELVEVSVGRRASGDGQPCTVVQDFLRPSMATAADAVRGRDDSTPRLGEQGDSVPRGTFRPFPLLTENDWEAANLFNDDIPGPPHNVPMLDDETVEEVLAAAQGTDDPPRGMAVEAPDDCDADEDAEAFRWVVLRAGNGAPMASSIEDERNAPPLPVPPESATLPVAASLFQYSRDLPSYMEAHGQSVRGYAGLSWSRWLAVRLCSEDGLDKIIKRARIIAIACARLGVPREQIVAMNCWNSSLTIFIPSCAAAAVPQVGYEKVAGHFAQALADLACLHTSDVPMEETLAGVMLPTDRRRHVRIDRRIYGPVAIHPAFNSVGPMGKEFAVAVSYDELVGMEPQQLAKLVAAPRPVPQANWRAEPISVLEDLWEYAVKAEQMRSKRFGWLTTDSTFVYADTFDWLLHGSNPETAHKRLYRAATNLLRLGCKPDVVTKLLGPAAHLSGLDLESVSDGVRFAADALVPEGFYLPEDCD